MKKFFVKDALEIAENLFIIGGVNVQSGFYLVFKSDVTEQMYYIDFDDPCAAREVVRIFKSFDHVRCPISI